MWLSCSATFLEPLKGNERFRGDDPVMSQRAVVVGRQRNEIHSADLSRFRFAFQLERVIETKAPTGSGSQGFEKGDGFAPEIRNSSGAGTLTSKPGPVPAFAGGGQTRRQNPY